MSLYVSLLSSSATLPTTSYSSAAGIDLYSSKRVVLEAKGFALIPTGISISLPSGTYGQIFSRSGLTVKKRLFTGAGVIDPDYRGEVQVAMFNFSEEEVILEEGERVAQLVLLHYTSPKIVKIEREDQLAMDENNENNENNEVRGEKGFGSSGK